MTYGTFKKLKENEILSVGTTLPDTTKVQCYCLIYLKST